MAVCDCHKAQDVSNISLVPDKGTSKPTFPPHLSVLSLFEVTYPSLCWSCRDLKLSCWKYVDLPRDFIDRNSSYSSFERESFDRYSARVTETDSKGDCTRMSEPITESVENQDTSGLWRKISFQVGHKIMQFLTGHSMMLLKRTSKGLKIRRRMSLFYWQATEPSIPLHLSTYKFDNETMRDVANNRWPRYKCAASLDPRNLVLFLAILSSIGTMVLIYLTLTVDQIGQDPAGE